MKYFLDTANITEINKWQDFIKGVTTNPILLKEKNIKDFLKEMEEFDKHFDIFIQIHTWEEYENLLLIKHSLHLKNNIIAKIPLIYPQGYDLLKKMQETCNNRFLIATCGTITYDFVQLHQAFEFGCDYCIVLIYKNNNPNFLEEALKFKRVNSYKTKLIGASFRTKYDVNNALLSGIPYVTLPPKVFELAFDNQQASKDWKDIYKD